MPNSKDEVELTLSITIKYKLNGESVQKLKDYLNELPHTLEGNGELSGLTDAEVDVWSHKVTEGQ